nr:hypothetical protein [Tanacetum cinerariifolium]
MESLSPHVVSAAKLASLNLNEFDLWKIGIEQYFLMTNYSLWEVILNGNSPAPTRVVDGVLQPVAPTTAEQRLARKNKLKACGTLLMASPDKHQLKFNSHKDAKTLMEAIEKSLKIYEVEVKSSSSASTSTQNIAFVSSSNTDSTNEPVSAAPSVYAIYAKMTVSSLPNIDADDLKEMDLKWQMSMKGHFARKCRSLKDLRRNGVAEPQRRSVPEPTNYALMAFSSSSSSFDNEVVSFSKAYTKAYETLQSHYDKLTKNYKKSQFDVISYQTGLESTEGRLLVYKQNESVFEEDIKLLKLEVQLRDNALVSLRQNLEKVEHERDEFKLKLENFQTSSKNITELLASQTHDKTGLGYNSQVFTRAILDCDDYLSSESDESLSPSPIYDRYQSGNGYHAVPPPYTGTFMPPKPDLVFNNAPNDVETDHLAFNVYDSEDEFETKTPQNIPSFVQPTEQVKSTRLSVQHVETSIPAATPKSESPKPTGNGKRRNRKARFGNHKHYAQMTLQNPQRHMVPAAVLTQSKPVPITAVRPVNSVVPKTSVTRPKQVKPIVTKPDSPTRRHINHSPPKGIPQHALKDKGFIDSECSRHMTGNMSYLYDFEELNGGYVAFGGNPKGSKIFRK